MDLITLFILFLTISHVSILQINSVIAVNPSGFSLKIIHSDSKESPLYPGDHLTPQERLQRLVQQSIDRARYIGLQVSSFNETTNSMNPDAVSIKVFYEGVASFYVAEIGIGTFPGSTEDYKTNYLIVDTGSETVWIQCAGASRYFHQDEPLYPAGSSTTYEPLRCRDNPYCDSERCLKGECRYSAKYAAGNAGSSGAMAKERFRVNLESNPPQEFNIVMGCGFYQYGFDYLGTGYQRGIPDRVTGILGLSSRPKSLVRQLGLYIFSHCLKPFRSDNPRAATSTYLRFGSDATMAGQAPRTPLYPPNGPAGRGPYRLNLLGIHVTEDKFRAIGRDFYIDSGTPFTVMDNQTFDIVAVPIRDYFQRWAIRQTSNVGNFGLCFIKVAWPVRYPTVTLRFQDADYLIDKPETLFHTIDDTKFCLGIVPGPTNILGAMQQAGKRILFNTTEDYLYFKAEEC